MRKKALSFLTIIALLLSAPAFAQLSTMTWVSGTGDDANSCSRTAPCRTFAGALLKTAANGEINALDSGSYGTVTIAKSITINGPAQQTSILASGTTGITIDGAGIVVNLRNLSINGASTTAGSGIRILNAAAVNIDNVTIGNFTGTVDPAGRAVSIETAVTNVRVSISGSLFYNTGNVSIQSAPTAGSVNLTVHDTRVYRSASSAVNVRSLTKVTISHCHLSNNAGAGITLEQSTAQAMVSNSVLSNNEFGVLNGIGGGAPTSRLYACTITANTFALWINAGSVFTHGNNAIRGNIANETPTGASLGTQ